MPSDAAAAMSGPDDLGLNDEPRATILRELMDAALRENLFGLRSCLKIRRIATEGLLPIRKDEGYARVENSLAGEAMVFRVRFGDPLQAIRFSRPPVLAFAEDSSRELSPAEVLHWLAGFRGGAALPGQDRLMADLELAESQGRAAREAISAIAKELARPRPSLHSWERLAALRDRPFHPVARAKRGWSMEDYRRYSAEGGNGWLLHWIAVVLGHFGPADETMLWRRVRSVLAQARLDLGEAARAYLDDLLGAATLPAKANLLSCFRRRGERPLYVDIPNPLAKKVRP